MGVAIPDPLLAALLLSLAHCRRSCPTAGAHMTIAGVRWAVTYSGGILVERDGVRLWLRVDELAAAQAAEVTAAIGEWFEAQARGRVAVALA